jgi:SWI/SNF-related matrix-associated actin-dependent regulator 1 of chromatin subfamily A
MNDLLMHAIRFLAGRCDGACLQDGQGFSKPDTFFGHRLADLSEWTAAQRNAAWLMARKYKGQLAEAGIDFDSIPEPPPPPTAEEKDKVEKNKITSRRIRIDGEKFVIEFPYSADVVGEIKKIPGRKWAKDLPGKPWTAPITFGTAENVISLVDRFGFSVDEEASARIRGLSDLANLNLKESKAPESFEEIPGIGGTLRPFQIAGVNYARRVKRTFIADEQGLGKTVEALAVIQAEQAYPAVVVCPASLKLNWAREAKIWLPKHSIAVIYGTKNLWYEGADITIINYDILGKHMEKLRAMNPKAVVFDESTYAKEYKSQRTKHCQELVQGVPIRLALTGTPILNRPKELLSQLKLLDRLNDLGGFHFFIHRYCGAYRGRFGMDLSGATNLAELATKLRSTCMVRRLKEDVLKELPPKQRARVPVELSNPLEYKKAEDNLIAWILETKGAEAADAATRAEQLVRIESLKQLAAQGKLNAAKEWIENFLESGQKLIFFANHISIQKNILEMFPDSAHIFGEDDIQERQMNVDRFQNDPKCQMIVCSLAAGGLGITLTAASNVAFLEQGWNPAIMEQGEDRAHRIGQTDSVTAWYLLADGTIDDEIYDLIEAKRAIVTGATEVGNASVLESLVDILGKRKKAQ